MTLESADAVTSEPIVTEPVAEVNDQKLEESFVEEANPAPRDPTEQMALQSPQSTNASDSQIKSQDEAMKEASMPTISTSTDKEERFINPRKSHWLTTFGFEMMEYTLPYDFDGVKKDFDEAPTRLLGGRIGVGGEIHLGKGLMTSSRVEGFFMGTAFNKAKNAGPEEVSVEIAYTKDVGQIYGVEGVQSLSYIFDLKTKNPFMDEMTYLYFEPFVEAGIGIARAFNKKRYKYDLGTQEDYEQSFTDELLNAKLGVGFNLTSTTGYFLYVKATQNRFDITKRKSKGYDNLDSLNFTDDSADMDPVTIFALGGGYKF